MFENVIFSHYFTAGQIEDFRKVLMNVEIKVSSAEPFSDEVSSAVNKPFSEILYNVHDKGCRNSMRFLYGLFDKKAGRVFYFYVLLSYNRFFYGGV